MPRMAERLANTFAGSDNNSVNLYQLPSSHVVIRSPANSISLSPRSPSPTNRRFTLIETSSGVLELDSEKNDLLDIVREANMDGVRHLKASDPLSRYIWCFIIVIFVILALVQIYFQLALFYSEPVATNIQAEYPSSIAFPTVAICNNNQFRLTYITGARILNRRARASNGTLKSLAGKPRNIFEEVIERSWDMDAVRFLRNAAHWKSRMILGCTWPNGTSCRLSDFKPVWTLTGLCWAINTDPKNPLQVVGSGVGHSIRLLLNVETYERVDACTTHFRTKSLPGLKILIYNQTSQPLTSHNGVNIPSGYAMDIRFRMQHHIRLPGQHCTTETPEHMEAAQDFNSSLNIRTCEVRKILREIEYECECSMARAFTDPQIGLISYFVSCEFDCLQNFLFLSASVKPCSVDDYFGCVRAVVSKAMEEGARRDCLPPCESVDYTPWQDLNRLPQNLMPALIEGHEEEDESDVEQDDMEEEVRE
ncbi:hypothetical protein RB195_019286 [Necator americanus]|uniref:Amiloride-sensitive sodium channel n=1 Tax=Necator americanus TaxID=51031 RepID=A0ABR1CDH0_NECAM